MTSLAATYDPVQACARQKCMAQEVNNGVQGDLMGYQEFVCMRQAGQKSGMRTYDYQVGPSERMAGDYFGAEYKSTKASEPWIQEAGSVPCSQLQSMLDTPAYGLEGYQAQNRACVQCPSTPASGARSVLNEMSPSAAVGIKRIGNAEQGCVAGGCPTPRHRRRGKHSGDQSWMLVVVIILLALGVALVL